LRQDLLIIAIQIREVFQSRLRTHFFHIWDALTLRNQKNDEAAEQQDHHQAGKDHGA
jgi:hypothetical protein